MVLALEEPVVMLTLVPAFKEVLIELANIVVVAPAVKLAEYVVPVAPLPAIVTSYGSSNHIPPRPALIAASIESIWPEVSM